VELDEEPFLVVPLPKTLQSAHGTFRLLVARGHGSARKMKHSRAKEKQ